MAVCTPPKTPRHYPPPVTEETSESEPGLPVSVVEVHTSEGVERVNVEIAATDEARATGLMYREALGQDEGMLFVFARDEVHSFWMRNTLIPLDMIFIAADGTIVGIVHSAQPRTDTPRSVGKPSRYVLEVPGGWSVARGVEAGDRVTVAAALEALWR